MSDVQRDLGALEARMNAVEERLERIEGKVDELMLRLAHARGGIRVLIAVGSIAGTLGALASKLIEWRGTP